MFRNQPPIVGIAGGIASGKSFVSERLQELGATVISADAAAHEVLKLEDVKREARARWGDAIFGPDGQIERQALAKIVFAPPPDGPSERRYLEQITHPRIKEIVNKQLAAAVERGGVPAIVLDVPLLFESGRNEICDTVLFVDAPQALRESRAVARGWTSEEFSRREATQQMPEAKRKLADVVIDNSGSIESVREQVDRFWQQVTRSGEP